MHGSICEVSELIRRDIQELRGVAILLVVLYHAGAILPSGFIGVDAFFVISGFVIAGSVRRSMRADDFSLSSFIGKRVRRILPALSVMLTIVVLASSWFSSVASRVQTVRTGLFASLGGANLFLYRFRPDGYFEVSEKTNALLHTWSLSLEEQFYLAFAIAIAVAFRVLNGRVSQSSAVKAIALVGFVSFVLCVVVAHFTISLSSSILRLLLAADELDSTFAFYLPLTRAWEFLAGVSLCWLNIRVEPRLLPILRASGVLLLLASSTIVPVDHFPGLFTLMPVTATMLLLINSRESSALMSGRLGIVFRWLGDRSYSWYLWHWPIIQFVYPFSSSRWAQLTAALASLLPAHLSFAYVEQRFRNRAIWRSSRRTRVLGVASILIPIAALSATRDFEPSLNFHLDAEMGCEYGELSRLQKDGPCTLIFDGAQSTAILLGDSHAGHLSEAFVGASKELGMNAILAVRGNSPFVYPGGLREVANPSQTQLLVDLAITRKVSVAVIAQSDYANNFGPDVNWESAFRPILEDLTAAGVRVVVVAQSVLMDADPRICSPIQISLSRCDQLVSRDTNELFAARKRLSSEKQLVSEFQGVALFDSAQILCPDTSCPNRRQNEWWWRDGGHISIPASRALTGDLSAVIRSLLAQA
jgi:peptidoglycan/LPS O-acetylase OafA/YrhL